MTTSQKWMSAISVYVGILVTAVIDLVFFQEDMLVMVGEVIVLLAPIAVYYAVFGLARANILFTIVEQGWCKIVLDWGKYSRTIGPGLQWIGIPGTYTLYKRKLKFFKSVTDKDGTPQAELREDEKDISSFRTTDYPYAFPFKDEEDSHSLPLSGMLAVLACIEDYQKAFFVASDWYSIMNSMIMPCFRITLTEISYDKDLSGEGKKKTKEKEKFGQLLWSTMTSPTDEDSDKRSIVKILKDVYGIWIKSIELRSVDPPTGWRDTTLAPYKAEREMEAAKYEAKTSAMKFDDTNQALALWIEKHPKATQDQIKDKQEELRQRALAKANAFKEVRIKGLENATTAVLGGEGGGAGILVGGGGGGKLPGGSGKTSKTSIFDEKTGLRKIEVGPSPAYIKRMRGEKTDE